MTLHLAISEVLQNNGRPMGCTEIANEIERLNLYTRPKDGNPAGPRQIRARAKNYASMFVIENAKISLKN